jgi:hypothetical protein
MKDSKQERKPLTEARSKLVDRFRVAVKKKKREEKIDKLKSNDRHWKGLS